MKTMAVSQFKARALRILSAVARTREPFVITKRGRPLARVVPCDGDRESCKPGRLAHTIVFEKDIVSPPGSEQWEACS